MKKYYNRQRKKFLEMLPKEGVGVEIGVFLGHYSSDILKVTKPKRLHLLDPWFLMGKWNWTRRNPVDALLGVIDAVKEDLEEKRTVINVGFSEEELLKFPDGYFDWAYIDSTHSYAQTMNELTILSNKVKTGGIICGHDWIPNPPNNWHRVYQAVNEFVKKTDYELLCVDNHLQWAIAKKEIKLPQQFFFTRWFNFCVLKCVGLERRLQDGFRVKVFLRSNE